MANDITRSTVNSEQYAAPEFQKSGFDLGYSRHSSWLLGRLHIGAHQYVMPSDKISGNCSINGTFNRIVTPLLTPVRAMCYQIFLPFRAIDRTFKKGMTPTKLNAMSANWNVPTVNTRQLVRDIFATYFAGASDWESDFDNIALLINYNQLNPGVDLQTAVPAATEAGVTVDQFLYTGWTDSASILHPGIVTECVNSLLTGAFKNMAKDMYLEDALLDIANNITVKCGSTDNPLSGSLLVESFIQLYLDALLTPFIGRYSYYGELKYNYLRPWDFYRIAHGIGNPAVSGYSDFLTLFDNTPQSEYPLRIMYAIWYERFRNVDLEPVSNTLPDWNEFGSTSVLDLTAGGNLLYLIYRIRSWEKDMFSSAQIDDMSRHVYAPVLKSSSNFVGTEYHSEDVNNLDANTPQNDLHGGSCPLPADYILNYYDHVNGTHRSLTCPVPANVNDILSTLDLEFEKVYGLDLNTLRQSQMLERYLKRNYLFGDEYQDRLLAHYNSRLSDMRINRPEILGQSISDYDMGQEVSNVSTDETKVGDRTATATISLSGDGYTTYAEEFGMVITIVSFMPRPMYDGIAPQLLCTKQIHFPLPEFAANNEEFGRKIEIASSGLAQDLNGDDANSLFMFGRYPAYHAWRSRVDEVGGMFLDELQDSTFRRFWGMYSDDTTPKLNYFFIHCRPNLAMFANTNLYDSQIYGDIVNECFVERVLPTPVEVI